MWSRWSGDLLKLTKFLDRGAFLGVIRKLKPPCSSPLGEVSRSDGGVLAATDPSVSLRLPPSPRGRSEKQIDNEKEQLNDRASQAGEILLGKGKCPL
jgi:hypothetical protein